MLFALRIAPLAVVRECSAGTCGRSQPGTKSCTWLLLRLCTLTDCTHKCSWATILAGLPACPRRGARVPHLPHPCPWGTLRLGNIKQSEVATVSPHTPDQFSKLLATIFHGHHPVGSIPQRGTLEHLRTAGGDPLSQAARTGRPQLWIGSSSWASVQAANFQIKAKRARPSQMIQATRSKPFALEVH